MLSIYFKLLYEDIIKSSNIFMERTDTIKLTLYGGMFTNHQINITLSNIVWLWTSFLHNNIFHLLSGVPVFLFYNLSSNLVTFCKYMGNCRSPAFSLLHQGKKQSTMIMLGKTRKHLDSKNVCLLQKQPLNLY